jgi:hypothetical protein
MIKVAFTFLNFFLLFFPANSELLTCRKFTHFLTTNFVGSLDIRVSREVFPIGVRSPEIRIIGQKK